MDRATWLETALRQAFAPLHLEIVDESALHAGHAAAGGGGHFRVLIVSDRFRDLDLVSRQRAVYAALGPAMKSEVHALSLRILTPEEWEQTKR
jgi:BolA family transcriptional regulator, general stress-responsive regulator